MGIIVMSVLCLLVMTGCNRTVYVPTERVTARTDTVYSARVRVDSVLLHDSVAVVQRGDTVTVTRYRDRYRVTERTDTVYEAMVDSVKARVPCPMERELTRWEKAKMEVGGVAMGVVAAMVIAVGVWGVRRMRK